MRRVLAAAVLAFVTFTLAGCTEKAAPPTDRFEVFAVSDRRPAPQLQGELLDGSGTYDAGADDGKILVVNFWGSWCGPCVDEAPELEAVYTARADEGVSFVGINVRDEVDNARAFAAQHFTYPSIFDPSSRLALDFAVAPNAIPSTIVIDRQGRIAAIARGSVYYSDLDPLVAELLAEAG